LELGGSFMLQRKQPKLCPDCPLSKAWKDETLKRIRQSQYTKEKEEPSNLKICMERRKILKELGLSCHHFLYGFDLNNSS